MSNQFTGSGNLGKAPALRYANVNGEKRPVLDLWIYFDRPVRKDETFEDNGGFWLNASVWGTRAEPLMKLLQKGMRVQVIGSLRLETWETEAQEAMNEMRLTIDHLAIHPVCLDSVQMRKKAGTAAPGITSGEVPDYAAVDAEDYDDIPA